MDTTKPELSTRYSPAEFEQRWYAAWEAAGYFTPDAKSDKPKFSIVIPPPNVTGRLHIGHALVNTLIDIVTRWKRMSGFEALFLPGTDHAGIATQMVVERELAKTGVSRHDLGREAFVEKVWQWKHDHGNQIKDQLMRLGCSCDWTRERFTLDEGLSHAVRTVFVKLYEDGLIYRDLAMVNWCPRCHTAISDLEVEFEERDSRIWSIDYPLADGSATLTVATTRPETMLGDTAVAVHPDDERYKHLIGKMVKLPLTGREIPVIGDAILVDPTFGTGVVKVTPAHDKNDYETGQRHELASIQVINELGNMTPAAGDAYLGLTREEARKKVAADLEAIGLLREAKPYKNSVAFCARCRTIVEPMVSRQWFVKIEPLAKPAIEAVRDGRITITPATWDSTYFNWMENIHDWCISRQLWWGHRIPAFTCGGCAHVMVAVEDPTSCAKCGSKEITQETDVLDTWFSSALWPFSTMGWPDQTDDLRAFYPTTTMITGFDILFFWVARMIMVGLRFTGEIPFSQVFLNGLVRDEHGQKMSKTKGNVIDPLEVADEFGADAVRFTLAISSSGRDIPLAKSRMQGYAAFATKIWNAARFAMMNVESTLAESHASIDHAKLGVVERWILSRCNATARDVNRSLEAFRFDEAANAIYQFFWKELCDWYIEMSKPVLFGREGTPEEQHRAKAVLLTVLDRALRLLHPFMPFITEEIWQKLGPAEGSIMIAAYPQFDEALEDTEAERVVEIVQGIITTVRNLRAGRHIPGKDRLRLHVKADGADRATLEATSYLLRDLGKLSEVRFDGTAPESAHRDVVGGIEFALELPQVEVSAEAIAKVQKEIEALEKELAGAEGRLASPQFVEKAPPQIIAGAKARRQEIIDRLATLRQNIAPAGKAE
ncbi:MAG: valine--tRNA ligase [Thermoanaerobaculia bacterium]